MRKTLVLLVCIGMYPYVSRMCPCVSRMYPCVSGMYPYVSRMLVVCIRMYPYVPYVTRMLLVCYPYVLVWCFSHDQLLVQYHIHDAYEVQIDD